MITKADLSAYLHDFLEGGEGYLLDCFMQERTYPPALQPFAVRLFEIHERYSNEAHPIGLANPEAKADLWAMVQELENSDSSNDGALA